VEHGVVDEDLVVEVADGVRVDGERLRCMLGMPEAYDSIRWPSNLPCPLICAWVAYGVNADLGSVR